MSTRKELFLCSKCSEKSPTNQELEALKVGYAIWIDDVHKFSEQF
jgi:hypothetical protein